MKPIKILQFVGGMNVGGKNRGGVQTWLMNVYRNIDRNKYVFDFLVHTSKKCHDEEEINSIGGSIVVCSLSWNVFSYIIKLIRIIKSGKYDVVHCHNNYYSGIQILCAYLCGIPIRIVHSHSDSRITYKNETVIRKFYIKFMKLFINTFATIKLYVSSDAAIALFGETYANDIRSKLIPCGIDVSAFMEPVSSTEVRNELGIPKEAFVIGHVGRFSDVKNHIFLIDIFLKVLEYDDNAFLVCVGDGETRSNIENIVKSHNIQSNVIFTGARSDVNRIMKGAFDVFVFPSKYEGLSLALIEAQACGLPIVMSNTISSETILIEELVKMLSINESPVYWALEICSVKSINIDQNRINKIILNSAVSIDNSISSLLDVYDEY